MIPCYPCRPQGRAARFRRRIRLSAGKYEFPVAYDDRIGTYHHCSLIFTAVELESREPAGLSHGGRG